MKHYLDERQKHPTWTFDTFCQKNRRIKNRMLTRFKNIVENNGNYKMKVLEINESVLEKFNYARNRHHPVHDKDLRRWALHIAKSINFEFKASLSWVYRFKKENQISSRKAKIISSRSIQNQEEILNAAKEFQELIKTESWKWPIVLNTDQMGFNKELHFTRTLSFRNEKDTYLAVKSMNNCTHSYTVQPTITIDGKLYPNFLLYLYEPTGKIGPTVKYFQAPNVVVTCSSSGKLSKGHIKY